MAAAASAARPETSGGVRSARIASLVQAAPQPERSRIGLHRLDQLHLACAL